MSHITTRPITRSAAVIATAAVCALATPALSADARTFDFNSAGTMTQQPLPDLWWCAETRVLLDRNVPCKLAVSAHASTARSGTERPGR